MKQISILGCGWLGLPLAKSLIGNGFSVHGSTTSPEKISVLENIGIQAFQIEIGESQIKGEINLFLDNSEILIIDIPPKLRNEGSENFVQKIQNLIPFIEKSAVEKVIFISSTSVYGDSAVSNFIVTEETKPNPITESGKQLVATEILLQKNPNFKTTVLRFGGLIGEDRDPTRVLVGKKIIENPDLPINFIHQKDCIGIIEKIIELGLNQTETIPWDWQQTFNVVNPFHPTRKHYYTQKALELNLLLPEFDEKKLGTGKIVSSDKIENILNYKFGSL
ncbi:SDR family oxidoreductase [Flavobacterium sp.]|uniref:SDR family oxidoreductase n=1 Tax=Flavobacterium sp. TaxID=239 RepID=UPI002488D068|nr:SDR family oxidoreductase [Flavobacterium sp.]MDI1317679.1 SDR family oxidoreductase [Flavobacterium sp.]